MTWPAPRALLTAFNSYLAVILALYVAFKLNLQNPWWAMATVYIAQPPSPLTGAIWAKAFYRIVGTVIGAVGSVVLIPNLSNSSPLLVTAIGVWVGFCVFGGLLDRTPRSYIFLLAGYTVALAGLPVATSPEGIFDIAIVRAEEVIIGVLALAVVQSVLLPRSVATVMLEKLDSAMMGARSWIDKGLQTSKPGPVERQLALNLTEINLLATDWRFEGTLSRPRQRALWALEERLVALLAAITAVEDAVTAIGQNGDASGEVPALIARFGAWKAAATATDQASVSRILEEVNAAGPMLGAASDWAEMQQACLIDRLADLATLWWECLLLAEAVQSNEPDDQRVAHLIAGARPRTLHVDWNMAMRSGCVAAATVIGVGVFGIAIRWESTPYAIALAAMCCALFATADDPTSRTRDLFIGLIAILPLSLVYEFAVLPTIDGFPLLSLSLFPVIFTLGILITYQRIAIKALGLLVGFSAGLALQPSFTSSLPGLLNVYCAVAIGPLFALAGLGLTSVIPPHRAVERLLRAGWRELASLMRAPTIPARTVWASRMLDRVGLLIPRLLLIRPADETDIAQIMQDLRLGMAIVELKKLRAAADLRTGNEIDAALMRLAYYFEQLSRGTPMDVPAVILNRLDVAISGLLRLDKQSDRYAGIDAALSFRRILFPLAPDYLQLHPKR